MIDTLKQFLKQTCSWERSWVCTSIDSNGSDSIAEKIGGRGYRVLGTRYNQGPYSAFSAFIRAFMIVLFFGVIITLAAKLVNSFLEFTVNLCSYITKCWWIWYFRGMLLITYHCQLLCYVLSQDSLLIHSLIRSKFKNVYQSDLLWILISSLVLVFPHKWRILIT